MLEATGGKRVDLVIDQVSGNIFNATQKATAIRGRIVNVGRLGGMSGEFDFNLHALRRIQYLGVTFRTRSRDEVRAIAERMRDRPRLFARRGRGRAGPHAGQRPFRQDRAAGIGVAALAG